LNFRPYILTNKFKPTDSNIEILSKGPSFCPPFYPKFNIYITFLNDFIRKLQWHLILKNRTRASLNRFGNKKSTKCASQTLINRDIKLLCNKIFNSSMEILKRHYFFQPFDNKVSNSDSIKFTVADKGSNWVILSKSHYDNEALTQLSNSRYYNSIVRPKSKHNFAAINRLINFLYKQKYINLTEKRFLQSDNNFKIRNFYLLPKIHKTHWSVPNCQPKGRPIVNCKESESYKIALFIDYFLQPIVKKSSSYIQDTFNFIAKINQLSVKDSDFLVTIDVESLYTNIPVDGAIEAIKLAFSKFPDNKRPDSVLINLLKIILFNNDFTFNEHKFLQNSGVAMGQRFAPSVANIYLSLWEENLQKSHSLFPKIWFRYIDDIFTIWPYNESEFDTFFNFINNYDCNIKLTYDKSITTATFLDLTIFKRSNNICHKVFFKKTNSHSILHKTSNHPQHIFRGITYSQIRRWASLCSFRDDFNNVCNEIFPIWRTQDYSRTLIRNSKKLVLKHLNLVNDWKHGFEGCQMCPLSEHTFKTKVIIINNYHFSIIGNYNCSSINVIYLIFCNDCKLFYVGQCKNFHHRMLNHLTSIKNNCSTPVHKHFRSCSIKNFRCTIIDSADTTTKLKIKESKYIKKFNTRFPNGLNIIENITRTPSLTLPFNNISQKISSNVKNICKNNKIDINTIFKQGKSLSQILN